MMQVILKEDVINLGTVGELVTVKAGYARNYLLPQNQAVLVTEENLKELAERRAKLEVEAQAVFEAAQAKSQKMVDLSLNLTAQAHEDGQLFGSINIADIQKALADLGHIVEKRELHIDQGVVRSLGAYEIIIQLHSDVKFKIPLEVTAADVSDVPDPIQLMKDEDDLEPSSETTSEE
jgi:large subunit ribosomal protein L9